MIAKEKNTRIIALLLALLMILMNIMPVTSLAINGTNNTDEGKMNTLATPTVTLKADVTSITAGQTIYVEVYVTGDSICSIAGTLSYDSTIFNDITGKSQFQIASGLDGSGSYGEWTPNSYSTTTKTFIVEESSGSYYTIPNGGYLFRIPFTAKANAASATIKILNLQVDTPSTVATIASVSLSLPTSVKYNLVINPNGGTWSGSTTNQTFSLSSGETKTLASPTRTGYVFAGWTSSDASSTVSGSVFTMGTANTTLTANWSAATYTLTINPQGGTYNGSTSNTTVTGSYGGTTSIAEATPPTGYTVSFDLQGGTYSGSTTIADKVQPVTFNYWTLSGVGGWTQAKSGTFTFQADATLNANYTKGSVALPANPTRAGYTFGGWYTEAGVSAGSGTYIPTANIKLVAKWNEITYTITYALSGGTNGASAPTSYSASTLPAAISNPTRIGYTFKNWTVVVAGGTTTTQSPGYSIPVGTAGNVTLTANWTANNYQVEYVANGGTGTIANSSHIYDTASNLTKNINGTTQLINRTGYTFKGWATVAGATIAEYTDGQSVTTLEPNNNATKKLYAVWEPISYNITYNLDGGAANPANPTTYSASTLPLVLNTPVKTGYIFSGWTGTNIASMAPTYTVPTGTTGDLTFTANWTAITYTVNFDANGGTGTMTPNTKTLKYDESYIIPTSGYTKTGYILKGWAETQTATLAKYAPTATLKNLTTTTGTTINLYAVWGTQAYNITYTGGGTASPSNPATYDVTNLPISLTAPTKIGYIFDGWTGSGITTMTKTYSIPVGTTGDLTYTANWTPVTYYITYKGSGETSGSMSNSTHKYDTGKALNQNTFVKNGYTFKGWTTVNGGTTVQYTDQQTVVNLADTDAKIITLYAVWEANGYASYTIQYYKNDGSGTYTLADTETQSNVIGLTVTAPTKTYTGYTENTTYSGRVISGVVKADGTLLLKRYYDKDVNNMKVTFVVNNASSSVTPTYQTVTTGTPYGTLPTPTAVDGWEFQGWYAETTYSIKVDQATVVTATTDHFIYAKWKKTKVTVTYVGNGGTVTPGSSIVTIGLPYGTIPTPNPRSGYTFEGWYTDTSYSTTVDETTIVTATVDHSIYAKWKKTSVTVTFVGNGGTVTPGSSIVNIGQPYGTIPTPNSRSGYTFEGWYTDTSYSTTVDETTIVTATVDHSIYAKWKKTSVTVTFVGNGGTVTPGSSIVNIGQPYGTIPTPNSRSGYTFEGWYTDTSYSTTVNDATIVTATVDHSIYAKWKAIEYKITYGNVDGASNSNPTKYTVADADIILAPAVKAGFNFIGWYQDTDLSIPVTVIDTSKQEDVTVYAKWEVANPTTKLMYYVKNLFRDPTTELNAFDDFDDAKRYADSIRNTGVVVWDANGDIVYDPSQKLYLKSNKYYIGDIGGIHLDEWIPGDLYLFNIEPQIGTLNAGTNLTKLIANLQTNGTIKIYNKSHVEIAITDLISTGMQIVVTKGDESITLDIIVKGDLDGNGKLTITDLSKLNQYTIGMSTITGIYAKAADMDYNSRLSITDLSCMNQALLSSSI